MDELEKYPRVNLTGSDGDGDGQGTVPVACTAGWVVDPGLNQA